MAELEVERDGLKERVLKLTEEKYVANGDLAEAHATVLGKAELLSKANDAINDLKLKLEALEGTLSEVGAREETLTKGLEEGRQLQRDDATEHKEYVESIKR